MRGSAAVSRRALRAAAGRSATLALIVVSIFGTLSIVFLSPLALTWLPEDYGTDWSKLSNIGQTYGVASAILAVLALAGVAVSLLLQQREAKAAREQALRGLHVDLLRMALDEDAFLECWGNIGVSEDRLWHRQHIYLNLVVSHWQLMWEIGAMNEAHLRLAAAQIFGGPLGRRFWAEVRTPRPAVEIGRRASRFHAIIEDEYQRALANLALRT
jgi:hypothetical protein